MFNGKIFKKLFSIFLVLVFGFFILNNFVNLKFFTNKKLNMGFEFGKSYELPINLDFGENLKNISIKTVDKLNSNFIRNNIKAIAKIDFEKNNIYVLYNKTENIKNLKSFIKKIEKNFNLTDKDDRLLLQINDDTLKYANKSLLNDTKNIFEERIKNKGFYNFYTKIINNKIVIKTSNLDNIKLIKDAITDRGIINFYILSKDNLQTSATISFKDKMFGEEVFVHKEKILTNNDIMKVMDNGENSGRNSMVFLLDKNSTHEIKKMTQQENKVLVGVVDNYVIGFARIDNSIYNNMIILNGNITKYEIKNIVYLVKSGSINTNITFENEKFTEKNIKMINIIFCEILIFFVLLIFSIFKYEKQALKSLLFIITNCFFILSSMCIFNILFNFNNFLFILFSEFICYYFCLLPSIGKNLNIKKYEKVFNKILTTFVLLGIIFYNVGNIEIYNLSLIMICSGVIMYLNFNYYFKNFIRYSDEK